jgi:putative ABC transport system permease protein
MGFVLYNDATTSNFTSMASACLYLKLAQRVNEHDLVDQVNKIYLTYDKATPFTYYFMDDAYTEMYGKQERLGNLLGLFTALTIFIACMGLFGLSSFSTAQRMKEVCIRKVLGASTQSLVTLLIQGFFWLIFIALLIAAPVAWYIMHHWLDNYAYHIQMNLLPILLTGIAVLGLGTMTVISQAIKAASSNPVIGLRAS